MKGGNGMSSEKRKRWKNLIVCLSAIVPIIAAIIGGYFAWRDAPPPDFGVSVEPEDVSDSASFEGVGKSSAVSEDVAIEFCSVSA